MQDSSAQGSSSQASSTQVSPTQIGSTRTSQASVSAALAAANAALRDFPSMRLGRPDSGRSLAEMAQRDLDAALQLLTDRAQYITGSSGAAIALRRYGTNDMLCRASTGSSAPELGTLLSTEFGLSGESVRTRRALRCDDAERDARVNHDVCREVGIASVVVMPVVHDDEVLGVFELFSGNAHAFGERDMSALQRLSEMVETAVRLAMAAQSIPERLKADISVAPSELTSEKAGAAVEMQASGGPIAEKHEESDDLAIDDPIVEVEAESAQEIPAVVFPANPLDTTRSTPVAAKAAAVAATAETARIVPATLTLIASAAPLAPSAAASTAEAPPVFSKRLLWSAGSNPAGDTGRASETDQSHVPPVFRNLRKCEACGFPVSAERALCVECEEKKWRGQLKPRAAAAPAAEIHRDPTGTPAAVSPAPARDPASDKKLNTVAPQAPIPQGLKPDRGVQTIGTAGSRALPGAGLAQAAVPVTPVAEANVTEPKAAPAQTPTVDSTPATAKPAMAAPELVFSAALEPSQSWFGRNKYVLGALLAVAGTVAAILLLR